MSQLSIANVGRFGQRTFRTRTFRTRTFRTMDVSD